MDQAEKIATVRKAQWNEIERAEEDIVRFADYLIRDANDMKRAVQDGMNVRDVNHQTPQDLQRAIYRRTFAYRIMDGLDFIEKI